MRIYHEQKLTDQDKWFKEQPDYTDKVEEKRSNIIKQAIADHIKPHLEITDEDVNGVRRCEVVVLSEIDYQRMGEAFLRIKDLIVDRESEKNLFAREVKYINGIIHKQNLKDIEPG